jgi:UDP-3-O-[3-hydroxymyristoyl] glucosamine N-acyltransferase
MILYNTQRPLLLIGYNNSTIMQEALYWFGLEMHDVKQCTPESFSTMSIQHRKQFQYMLAFTLDQPLRRTLLSEIDQQNLDLVTYVHPTATLGNLDPTQLLSPGCFVAPHSTILLGSHLGVGCIVESYCLISHHVRLGQNCHLHSGVMIAGRCEIADNCVFNFRSTVLPKLDICHDIVLGAVSTATKSLTQPGIYVGTPCRRIGDSVQ